jgi:hypothetical protein
MPGGSGASNSIHTGLYLFVPTSACSMGEGATRKPTGECLRSREEASLVLSNADEEFFSGGHAVTVSHRGIKWKALPVLASIRPTCWSDLRKNPLIGRGVGEDLRGECFGYLDLALVRDVREVTACDPLDGHTCPRPDLVESGNDFLTGSPEDAV